MVNKIEQEIIRMRDKLETPKERFEYVMGCAKEVFGEAYPLLKNAIIMTTNKINNKYYALGYNAGLKRRRLETSQKEKNGKKITTSKRI